MAMTHLVVQPAREGANIFVEFPRGEERHVTAPLKQLRVLAPKVQSPVNQILLDAAVLPVRKQIAQKTGAIGLLPSLEFIEKALFAWHSPPAGGYRDPPGSDPRAPSLDKKSGTPGEVILSSVWARELSMPT